MRAYLPAYEMRVARSLAEALDVIASEPGAWTPFAGGTDLMVLFNAGLLPPGRYLSIWGLAELSGIEVGPDDVTLGALTTYTEVLAHREVQRLFPSLCQAARETGGAAIQNRGTLGGNIANGSPAADSPPALLAYGAELELVSTACSRWVDYAEFHTGYKQSLRRPDELIASLRIPRPAPDLRHYYRKVGTRRAQAISKVVMSATARGGPRGLSDVRIALGSVAPTVVRCRRVEAYLEGRAVDGETIAGARRELAAAIAPIDDVRSTRVYRLRVAANLLEEFLTGLDA